MPAVHPLVNVALDDHVPTDHFYQQTFVRVLVRPLCAAVGRPPIVAATCGAWERAVTIVSATSAAREGVSEHESTKSGDGSGCLIVAVAALGDEGFAEV